jgi:hypothetical protein
LTITIRRATAQDAPALAHMLRELGLFSQVSSEAPHSTQARAARYLQFYDLLEAIRVEALARGCSPLSLINLRHRESYERGFYARRGWQERSEAASFVYLLETEREG